MAQFKPTLQKMLAREDSYVNDPYDDPLGESHRLQRHSSKYAQQMERDIHKKQSAFPANLEKDTELESEM